MTKKRAAFLLCLVASCGGHAPGPFDQVPASRTIVDGKLSAPVDVVRDRYGVPHIYAKTLGDAAFANGYVLAADRLVQMDIFRHLASGTLGELFGALEASTLATDLELRMHGFRRWSEASWNELVLSTDPRDQEGVEFLTRYADGVNHYVEQLKAGKVALGAQVGYWLDPKMFSPWTPVDSLAIGRLQQWALSYGDEEIDFTRAVQDSQVAFDSATDPARRARASAFFDLFLMPPMDPTPTINGFPNVDVDTGSRAALRAMSGAARPRVPESLLNRARASLGLASALGVEIKSAFHGSNNWVVGPQLTGGQPIIANDPHLQLSSPAVWHLVHIDVPGALRIAGVSFPGVPGIILGHNEHVAWGATVVSHDVTDFYLETIVTCPQGSCVVFRGNQVAIETRQEQFNIGVKGTILDSFTATYEFVPHHGPILPNIVNNRIVPRTTGPAISVKYTGHAVTRDFRAFFALLRAQNRAEAFAALGDYSHGAQNFVIADDSGDFGWTSYAHIPVRSPACFTFHPDNNRNGLAPYFVLPGDGRCEWEGWLDPRHVPHAINPATGFLATANQDPVGETYDGDALNGPLVEGRPLYVGWRYDSGFRNGRITRRLQALAARGAPMTLQDMASIQGDTHSNVGEAMRPQFARAHAALLEELAIPGTHADLAALAASLTPVQKNRIADAAHRLAAWSLATPAAVEGSPSPSEIADSAATTIFNAAMVSFLAASFADELKLIDQGVGSQTTARAGLAVFERPATLRTGIAPETREPRLCDDLATAAVESCRRNLIVALDEAMAWAAAHYQSDDPRAWRWGQVHTATLTSQLPDDRLSIPPPDDPVFPGGFPRPGDEHCVDVGNSGYNDFRFSFGSGASMRHITQFAAPGTPVTWMALPGGQIHDLHSAHFRDLADHTWRTNQYFVLPWTSAEVLAEAEDRWRFRR